MVEIVRPETTYQMFADIRCDLNKGYETAYNRFMESVYQNTFWLVVAFLAVLLPLYVLAVSLLGRAIGIAKSQERKNRIAQQERAEAVTAEAKEALTEALDVGKNKELRTQLKRAENDEKKATRQTRRVSKRYGLLRLWPCVGFPGILLASAAILSAAACGFGSPSAGIGGQNWLSTLFWGVSLALIVAAVARLYLALRIVQEVSLSSDEIAMQRNVEALKAALIAFEEEKRPELKLDWLDPTLPLSAEASSDIRLAYAVALTRGEVARTTSVFVYAPPGFEFPGKRATPQLPNHPVVPDYIMHESTIGDVLNAVKRRSGVTLKCCKEAGQFKLYYQIICEGFSTSYEEIPIEITASESDPIDAAT